MQRFARAAILTGCAAAALSVMYAQRGGGDWMTIGYDPQRSSWVRGDGKISLASMSKPGFELVWKIKLNNEPRELNSITPPALLDFYIGYKGFRTLGLLGGSSGRVFGIDLDLARIEWEKNLASPAPPKSTVPCPGGMTSSVTRPTAAGYPGPVAIRAGRGGQAKGAVGAPHEGAVTLKQSPPPAAAPAAAPRGRKKNAPAPNPYGRGVQLVSAISADGKLHSMYVSNGEEPNPPVPFLPANANAVGLIVYDDTAYAATVNGCGGVDNGVWAVNTKSKKVARWKSKTPPAGSDGFAVAPDGTIIVATTGGEVVALGPGSLAVKSSYKSGKKFTSTPVIFEHGRKDLLAVAAADGEILVLDSAALGSGPLAKWAGLSSPNYAAGALSSWEDPAGGRWLLVPDGKRITALKLSGENGAPALTPGWTSRDMVSPIAPAIVNGVVFALSTGEYRADGAGAADRVQRSSKAVLYALDGSSGKELWNSGDAIASFVDSGGIALGGGRVYVGAHDGTLYAFGFPMEH
ncbi:MAG TPA: PQQ-binding-like beta-propeller repeat protein [Bryobacteraceae bacterium]|nr:PQQ-binding-like beta-propeller repeat protein [Bryobacteraceae bacterium]